MEKIKQLYPKVYKIFIEEPWETPDDLERKRRFREAFERGRAKARQNS